MKAIFWNTILVLLGLPLIGLSFLVIGFLYPDFRQDFTNPDMYRLVSYWLISLSVFAIAYILRMRWFLRDGVFNSWHLFKSFFKENHGLNYLTPIESQSFLYWSKVEVNFPEGYSPRYPLPKIFKETYKRIQDEYKFGTLDSGKRNSLINGLMWYAYGKPEIPDWDELECK